MKKIIAAVLAAYVFQSSEAQGIIPPIPPPPPPQGTTAPPVRIEPPPVSLPLVTPQPVTTAPLTTAPQIPVVPIPPPLPVITTAPPTPVVTAPIVITPPQVPAPPIITARPVTPAPVTAAPTTAAPTFNPYCPPATALNNIGSMVVSQFPTNQNAACKTNVGPGSIARDYQGQLSCGTYHCCLCSEINCGGSGFPCENLKISDSGAVGVRNIVAIGGSTGFWGLAGWQNGAQIDCSGLESCKAGRILGQHVGQMQCTGDFACEGATIMLEPSEQMNVQCNGMMSCSNANIEIIIGPNTMITELGTIEFNGQQSGMGATITIRNLGANPVILHNLECMNPTACPNTQFVIEGNIMIENCDLQGMQNLNSLPPIIQSCALNQIGAVNPWGFPATPIYPVPAVPAPAPQTIPNTIPALPVQPVTPVTPITPVAPAPVTPIVPAPAPVTPIVATPSVPAPAPGTGSGLAVTPGILPVNSIQQMQCSSTVLCNHKSFTITPAENWKLDCSVASACAGMQLTLNVGLDPLNSYDPVTRIDSLRFVKPYSGMGATVTINSGNGAYAGYGGIELNDIRCEDIMACSGLTVVVDGGIDVANMNMDCQEPTACQNCKVIQSGTEYDCMQLSALGGNTAGGGMYNNWAYPAVPAPPTNPTWQQPQTNTNNWQQQQLMWQYYQQWI